MGMSELGRVLDKLRSIDDAIDFSRGELQWRIVILLSSKGPSSVAEISTSLGSSKKAVIDAVRKLIKKELVSKVKYDVYELTEQGRSVVGDLASILNGQLGEEREAEDPLNNPTHFYYFTEIAKASVVCNGVVPVGKLSREIGVSRTTLKFYLDLFSGKYNFFKRRKRKTLNGVKEVFVLTEEGRKFALRIPEVQRLRRNIFMRFLLNLTFSLRFESALIKLMAFFSFTSPFLIHYRYLEEVKVIQVVWLYFLLLTALMSVVAYLLMRI